MCLYTECYIPIVVICVLIYWMSFLVSVVIVVLSVVILICHYVECHYADCYYAECYLCSVSHYFNGMLSGVNLDVIRLSFVMLSVIIQSVVMLSVIMLNVTYAQCPFISIVCLLLCWVSLYQVPQYVCYFAKYQLF